MMFSSRNIWDGKIHQRIHRALRVKQNSREVLIKVRNAKRNNDYTTYAPNQLSFIRILFTDRIVSLSLLLENLLDYIEWS